MKKIVQTISPDRSGNMKTINIKSYLEKVGNTPAPRKIMSPVLKLDMLRKESDFKIWEFKIDSPKKKHNLKL